MLQIFSEKNIHNLTTHRLGSILTDDEKYDIEMWKSVQIKIKFFYNLNEV